MTGTSQTNISLEQTKERDNMDLLLGSQKNKEKNIDLHNDAKAMTCEITCLATQTGKRYQDTFDTDSRPIGIDNRCSACISHKKEDFVGELKSTKKTIRGF